MRKKRAGLFFEPCQRQGNRRMEKCKSINDNCWWESRDEELHSSFVARLCCYGLKIGLIHRFCPKIWVRIFLHIG